MKILFMTANRVGDAVLSTGLLASLAQTYPDADFTIACGPYAANLFRAAPRLERLIVLKKRSFNRHWIKLWAETVGTRWDLIVDLRNSAVSRLLRADKRFYGGKNSGRHKVVENAAVLALDPPPSPHIWLDVEADKEALEILGTKRPLLALGPVANWPPKQWPIERFIELAQKLISPDGPLAGGRVVVIADEHECAQLMPFLKAVPSISVIGRNLLTVAACLKQAQLFVGNDSGLMHIAAAVGTKTLGLFGPGYEEIYGPWGPHAAFIRTDESREQLLARLPNVHAREPNLMVGLSVGKVFEAAVRLLKS